MKKFFKKLGSILFCLLPFLITLGLQVILSIPVLIYYSVAKYNLSSNYTNIFDFLRDLMNIIQDPLFAIILTVIWVLASSILFFYWYQKIRDRKIHRSWRQLFSPLSFVGLVLMAVGMQLLINFAYSGLELIKPEWFEVYNQLMNMTNYGTIGGIIMIVYAVVGAPIHEELVFRGVTLHYAQKAMPFFIANILQALLFGIMHMNLIQGTYAFVAGLVLGYIYHKTKSLRASILFHFFFNLIGSFPLFSAIEKNLPLYIFVALIGMLITFAGFVLFNSKKIEQ